MRNEKHRYYTKLLNAKRWWGDVRLRQLEAHPLCQLCEQKGLVVAAVDVHHIVPVEQGRTAEEMERFCYDPSNLISLCIPCHIAVHKEMKSHVGQTAKLMPAEGQDNELRRWKDQHGGMAYQMPRKTKAGVCQTVYGWLTPDEYQARQREDMDAWAKRHTPPVESKC